MNSNITKLLFAAVAALAVAFTVSAQSVPQFSPLKIRINNPEAKGIEFKALRANFGPRLPAQITAGLVRATDGVTEPTDNDTWTPIGAYCCETPINGEEISGNVALISRGVCEFGAKVLNAEEQGAVAVIIANRAPIGLTVGTHVDGLIWMGAGVVGDSTTIPSMFITYEDLKVLEDLMGAIAEPLNITILNSYMYDAAVAYAYSSPEGNVRTLDSIQLVLINRDTVELSDITVTATITTPGGSMEALTATLDTLAVPAADASGETQVFFDGYSPAETGTYTVEFTASTPGGDTQLDSESLTMSFEVANDYTFRLDDGDINENTSLSINIASYQGPANLIFNVGALYRTGSVAASAPYASFIITNPGDLTPDMEFKVSVSAADPDGDGNFDNNGDGIVDALDFNEAASAIYTVSGEETPGELILVEFDPPAALDANQVYLLMVAHDGLEDDNFFPPAFAVAGTQNLSSYGNVFELAFPGADTYQFELDGFDWWNDDTPSLPHGGLRPVIRLHLDGFSNTGNLPLLADGQFTIMGNPDSELLKVGFQLDKQAEEVRLVVLDMLGRVVAAKRLENVLNETHAVDVRGLAAGTYLVTVVTPEGYRTKKFVVAR